MPPVTAVQCVFQLFVLSSTRLLLFNVGVQRWRRVSLLMLMPSCDQCDLKLLVGSAPFHISWINSPPGREPLPLWFSRWHHLQKSCPLKLEPSKYFTRGCWCQHVQPLKYVSYHVTAVIVAYTREAVKFFVVFFFLAHFKMLAFILFSGGGL